MPLLSPASTIFFLCDVQTKFRPAIHGYDHVVATANKLIKVAKILGCQVLFTTQNAKALGPTDPAIDLSQIASQLIGPFDKTLFSMVTPDVTKALHERPHIRSVLLFGIESHICVMQTALNLIAVGLTVYIPADGVSSCNPAEVPIALARLRSAGAVVSTSESVAFELMQDASLPTFREFSKLIKEEKAATREAGEVLILGQNTTGNNEITEGEVGSGGIIVGTKAAM